MQQITTNTFQEGMKSSLVEEIKKSSVYRKAKNLRLTNVASTAFSSPDVTENELYGFKNTEAGADLALTPIPGSLEAFQLQANYKIVGYIEHENFLYIASTDGTNFELGTFPSFNNGVLEYSYRAIKNIIDDDNYLTSLNEETDINFGSVLTPIEFKVSDSFILSNDRIEMLAKTKIDNSVDLYLFNLNGPDVTINSNLNTVTGEWLTNYYTLNSLSRNVHHIINETTELPTISFIELQKGGKIKNGTWRVFVRYVDKDNPTSFIAQSELIPVFIEGVTSVHAGDNDSVYGSSIKIEINNLSTGHEYFQIGLVHYNDGKTFQYVLNKKYKIEATKTVVINGTEEMVATNADEFLFLKTPIKRHATATATDSRLVMVNGFKTNQFHENLIAYAASVEIEESYETVGNGFDINDYNNFSYHSGEVYMFKLHAVFKDGTISDGYGMLGKDANSSLVPTNTYGVFRFSNSEGKPNYVNGTGIFIKKPKFVFPEVTDTWILNNVSHWVISRAERNPNRTYQGLAINLCNGMCRGWDFKFDLPGGINFDTDYVYVDESRYFPCLKQRLFYGFTDTKSTKHTAFSFGVPDNDFDEKQLQAVDQGAYAVQSPDIINDIHKGKVKVGSYFRRVGIVELSETKSNKSICFSSMEHAYLYNQEGYTSVSDAVIKYSQKTINGYDANGDGKYISKIKDGMPNEGFVHAKDTHGVDDQTLFNMPMSTPGYIATQFEWAEVDDELNHHICELYHQNPDTLDYIKMYDIVNTPLYLINTRINLNTESVNYEITLSGGDCYTSFTYWKSVQGSLDLHIDNWNRLQFDENGNIKDGGISPSGQTLQKITAGYGYVIGVVLECNYNQHAKISKGSNSFYPFDNDFTSYANRLDVIETPIINEGFNNALHYRRFQPFKITDNISLSFENRFDYTLPQSNGTKIDYWRVVPLLQFKEFGKEDGKVSKVKFLGNSLYAILENAIHVIPINERVAIATDASPIIVGAPTFMSDVSTKIADYGTQHQFSVIEGRKGLLYGIDVNRKNFWRLAGNKVQDIGFEYGLEHDSIDYFNNAQRSVNENNIPFIDGRINKYDIFSGYDREHSEVMFVFDLIDYKKVIVFSDKFNSFINETEITPYTILSLREKTLAADYREKNIIHQLNIDKENYLQFFGELKTAFLSISIAKGVEQKQWHSHELITTSDNLHVLAWETETQRHGSFVTDIPAWMKPVKKEGHWYIPIPRASSVQRGTSYQAGSIMEGQYIYFNFAINTRKYFKLLSINTIFTYTNG